MGYCSDSLAAAFTDKPDKEESVSVSAGSIMPLLGNMFMLSGIFQLFYSFFTAVAKIYYNDYAINHKLQIMVLCSLSYTYWKV